MAEDAVELGTRKGPFSVFLHYGEIMELLRQQEALSVIESADDLVTRQLLNNAFYALLKRYLAQTGDMPDLDACFFMEVMN